MAPCSLPQRIGACGASGGDNCIKAKGQAVRFPFHLASNTQSTDVIGRNGSSGALRRKTRVLFRRGGVDRGSAVQPEGQRLEIAAFGQLRQNRVVWPGKAGVQDLPAPTAAPDAAGACIAKGGQIGRVRA